MNKKVLINIWNNVWEANMVMADKEKKEIKKLLIKNGLVN